MQLDIADLRAKLHKPLRVGWVTQTSSQGSLSPEPTRDPAYHSVICCTASRQEARTNTWAEAYIQGAGDDSEGWSKGLTPIVFWQNSSFLLSASHEEGDIQELLMKTKAEESALSSVTLPTAIDLGSGKWPLLIGRLEAIQLFPSTNLDAIITCDRERNQIAPKISKSVQAPLFLYLESHTGKLGSRTLRDQLPRLRPFMEKIALRTQYPRLLFGCDTGRDLSVGVALTVLCLYFDDDGRSTTFPGLGSSYGLLTPISRRHFSR